MCALFLEKKTIDMAGSVVYAGRRVVQALSAFPRRVFRPVVDLSAALYLAPRVVRLVQARLCLLCFFLAAHPELCISGSACAADLAVHVPSLPHRERVPTVPARETCM